MKVLYWNECGPWVAYDGMLHVQDLNPEVKTKWKMSRWDMIKLGFKCIRAAITQRTT